jgi:hypothetical protein
MILRNADLSMRHAGAFRQRTHFLSPVTKAREPEAASSLPSIAVLSSARLPTRKHTLLDSTSKRGIESSRSDASIGTCAWCSTLDPRADASQASSISTLARDVKRYIDGVGGVFVTNIGHGDQQVIEHDLWPQPLIGMVGDQDYEDR